MLRIGILGTGGMASQRATAFAAISNVAVTAVFTRHAGKAAAICSATGATAYDDYHALLRQVDAVVVCLPNHLHAEHAQKALDAGRHVLVEYPLCLSHAHANDLQRAAERNGRVLMTGNTIIHEEMFRYVQQHLARLGRIVSAASWVAAYDPALAGMWYMDADQSGPTFACFHYHHIEYYRRLLGEVESVMARDESIADPGHPGRMQFRGGTLLMHHTGGGSSCIQWYLAASNTPGGVPRGLWLNGTQTSLAIIEQDGRSQAVWGQGDAGEVEGFANAWGVAGSSREFVEAVQDHFDHRARLESDLATLQVALAASDSARRGERVSATR